MEWPKYKGAKLEKNDGSELYWMWSIFIKELTPNQG
jgi:hypothetical protein